MEQTGRLTLPTDADVVEETLRLKALLGADALRDCDGTEMPDALLQDPAKKMSKSDENTAGFITMLDTPAEIMKKFKRAVTDSEARVYYGENKAGINNLMGIYSCITGKSYDEIEKEFEGRGYGDFKTAVGEAVVKELEPIQARYNELIKDKAYLEKCYSEAAPRAEAIARRTLQKVMKKVGYLPVAH